MVFSACKPALVAVERIVSKPAPKTARRVLFQAGEEPTLADMLDDPVVRRVMASDGVTLDSLWAVIDDARSVLSGAKPAMA